LSSLLNPHSQYIVLAEYLDICLKNTSTNWTQDIEEEENTFKDIIVVYVYNLDLINNLLFQKLRESLKIYIANVKTIAICLLDNIANRYILTN